MSSYACFAIQKDASVKIVFFIFHQNCPAKWSTFVKVGSLVYLINCQFM